MPETPGEQPEVPQEPERQEELLRWFGDATGSICEVRTDRAMKGVDRTHPKFDRYVVAQQLELMESESASIPGQIRGGAEWYIPFPSSFVEVKPFSDLEQDVAVYFVRDGQIWTSTQLHRVTGMTALTARNAAAVALAQPSNDTVKPLGQSGIEALKFQLSWAKTYIDEFYENRR